MWPRSAPTSSDLQVVDRVMAATGHASVDTGHKTGNVVLRLAGEGSGS